MKRILSLVLIFVLVVMSIGTTVSFALSTNNLLEVIGEREYILNSNGVAKIYKDLNAYKANELAGYEQVINESCLQISQEAVTVSLDFRNEKLCFAGKVYALGSNGVFNNNLFVGRFGSSGQFNVIQFRVTNTNEEPQILFLMEDVNEEKIVELKYHISENQYAEMFLSAKRETNILVSEAERQGKDPRIEVYSPIMNLLIPSKQCCTTRNAQSTASLQSNYTFKSTTSYSAVSANYEKDFKPFFDDLNNDGLANASTKMTSILSQTGWKLYKGADMFYVLHGVNSSSTEQLVGITVATLSTEKIPNEPRVKASYVIMHSVTLSYDKISKKADALFRDSGIRLEDAVVAVELVGGDTNFHYAWKSSDLDGKANTLNTLFAIVSKLGVANAIWSALTEDPVDSTDNVDYGTDTEQKRIYKGLVRATGNKTDSGSYLWSENNKLSIMGEYYSNKKYSSYRHAYGFKAFSLL